MKPTILKSFILCSLFALLIGTNACTPDNDYVTEDMVRTIIREELRGFLTEDQIQNLIDRSIPASVSENRIRQLIAEELKGSLTPAQINQIIAAVGTSSSFSEEELRKIIKEEIDKRATQWTIVNIPVESADWVWNEKDESYHAIMKLPELTESIFKEGGAIGYFKWGDNRKTPLPFSNTDLFDVTNANGTISKKAIEETISCDFELGNPSVVIFTRQLSDRSKIDNPSPADFQIVLIW